MQTHDAKTSAEWAPIMDGTAGAGAIQAQETDAAHTPAPVYTPEATLAHKAAEAASKALRLCGHGKMRTWADGSRMTITARVADYFWIECGCCWFYRGVALGVAAGAAITAALAAIL